MVGRLDKNRLVIICFEKDPKMRFNSLFLAAAAVAVLTVFAGNDAQAQSGSRAVSAASVLSGQFQGAPTGIAPNFSAPNVGSVVQGFSQGLSVPQGQSFVQGQAFTQGQSAAQAQGFAQGTGYVQGFPQGGTTTYVDAPNLYAPEYRPAPGSYHAQVATQTQGCHGCRGKGPVSTGQLVGGCAHCAKEPPIRTKQDYSAVPSCCGTLGQLDIPSLFTPLRQDLAPIGRAVGRPLFGQWQGF